MLTLENIKRKGDIISATYYPEDAEGRGIISVDTVTGEVIDFTLVEGYGTCSAAKHYGRKKLLEIADLKPLPEMRRVLWY